MKKILVVLTLSLLIYSCDLFDTRIPEKPNYGRSNYIQPYKVEYVIQNLKNSLADKNVNNYLNCFVDTLFTTKSFVFSASSEALIQFQMQDWGKDDEYTYFRAVIAKVGKNIPITLSLTDTIYSSLGGDSAVYSANYNLNVPYLSSSAITYSGNLEFRLVRDTQSLWSIYFWKDTKSNVNPSWSELKGSNY